MINGQYTPLNLNCLAELLQGSGLNINPTQLEYMGVSTSNTSYTTRGTIYTGTILDLLANVTSLAYTKIGTNPSLNISQSTYDALINMGSTTIPALGNSKPSTYNRTYSGEMTKYGWLRLIAYQAYTEFNVNGGTSYSDFLNTFAVCYSYSQRSNQLIGNYNKATTFLTSNYSNMSDLITSDITGVSLSTVYWGQDLIRAGRSIDLSRINDFGLPSVLLKTLQLNRALTPSLNVALLSAGFTSSELDSILNGYPVTTTQERLLYSSFCVISGNDLSDICILLNCQTPNLSMLADLLDPKKLFPNSYQTLTCPRYNTELNLPTNSKTYYQIYVGTEPNEGIFENQGARLYSILAQGQANACDAFSYTMMQIKNIQSMSIEKFAQVVTNLETVVGLDTGSPRYPIDPDGAITALNILAKGSNIDGTYNLCDFFGSITNLHYEFGPLKNYIASLDTTGLRTIYQNMFTLLSGAAPYENDLLDYIDDANAAIATIKTNNTPIANMLNTLYSTFGEYLQKEQDAREAALPSLDDIATTTSDIISFIDSINEFATKTQDKGPSVVLESIANTTTRGGNSLIGSMREIRNSERLGLVGGVLDSGIVNTELTLPRLSGTTARQSPVAGYTPSNCVANVPIVTGAATTPGSLAGSPEVSLIPTNLSIFNASLKCSVLTPSEAVNQVQKCNCDCWDNLQ